MRRGPRPGLACGGDKGLSPSDLLRLEIVTQRFRSDARDDTHQAACIGGDRAKPRVKKGRPGMVAPA